jgi:hypothetical protein
MDNWVYDLETLSNCIIAVFEHFKTDQKKVFILHKLKNDVRDFRKFIQDVSENGEWLISFNGLAFDSQILGELLNNDNLMDDDGDYVASVLYQYAQKTIHKQENKNGPRQFADYPEWELPFRQLDIFKMHHWDSAAKSTSLKAIQFSIDWPNVQEMPIHHSTRIETWDQINEILDYCYNDVSSTKAVLHMSKEQVSLRKSLTKEYGINLYSASEPRISRELFAHFLSKELEIEKKELKQLRTKRDKIVANDIILPYINFKSERFKTAESWFRNLVIDYTEQLTEEERKKKYRHRMKYRGMETDFALGGIHGARPGIFEADGKYIIVTADVESFYPNLAIRNRWSPAHLPADKFCKLYEWFFDERKKIPKTDPRNYVYKIILNSTYGLSKEENSFLYDPEFTMRITLNGQLSLAMLYEMVAERIPGAIPIMQNTDGMEMMIPAKYKDQYLAICAEWQTLTKLKLEHDEYSKMFIWDVNNYMAVHKNGKVKCKGRFEWEDQEKKKVAVLHKNKSFLVIPKAIYNYFIKGIDPADYLKSNRNIFDYCGRLKAKGDFYFKALLNKPEIVDRLKDLTNEQKIDYLKQHGWHESWGPENWVHQSWPNQEANAGIPTNAAFSIAAERSDTLREEKLQKMIRYYVSRKGVKLMKANPDGREMQVDSGHWRHTVFNTFEDKRWEQYNIDETYYLQSIYDEIRGIRKIEVKELLETRKYVQQEMMF